MPTYQYACTECGERLEVVQKFTDDPLTVCPACEGRLRKLFSPVGVVFKGSGFYKTDSRSTTKTAASGSGASTDSKSSAPSESKPSESKPSGGESSTPSKPAASSGSGSTGSGSASSSGDGSKVA